jgi:hypothetical protein
MNRKKGTSFFSDIKGTFLEEIMKIPLVEMKIVEKKVQPDDFAVGDASSFEKKCFIYYQKNYFKEDKGPSRKLRAEMYAVTALGIMRAVVTDRLNLNYRQVSRIWIRSNGKVVICVASNQQP